MTGYKKTHRLKLRWEMEDENGALRGRKWHSVDLEMQAMRSIYDDNGDDKWI